MEELKSKITEFLTGTTDIGEEVASDKLFSSSILNSIDLVSLIGYLEETFNIKVEPADVNHDNFDSIERIASFIEEKKV